MRVRAGKQFDQYGHVGSHAQRGQRPHNMEAYSTSSWLLWSSGKNADAEATLKQGIDANPDTYYMYDEMGIYWLFERRDPKAALPYYEKAVKFDCPFLTWNSLANCYEKTEQWQKALTAWEKATLFPQNAVALVRLKRVRARLAQQKNGQ
jgi:tetratricopeptide (TPR) repeat protein